MNYLLTWNCKHIANAQMRLAIEQINKQCGYHLYTERTHGQIILCFKKNRIYTWNIKKPKHPPSQKTPTIQTS